MNSKLTLLVVGLIVGGLIGWLTRPQAAEIKLGPVSIEVQGPSAADSGGSLTRGQTEHIAIYGIIGAVIGLGLGFFVDRRRPSA